MIETTGQNDKPICHIQTKSRTLRIVGMTATWDNPRRQLYVVDVTEPIPGDPSA